MMWLFRLQTGLLLRDQQGYRYLDSLSWEQTINHPDFPENLKEQGMMIEAHEAASRMDTELLPPIDHQEVWASGVTYLRSRAARMEEAEASGGGDFYDKVYLADRPELFFKATAGRTVGHGDMVYIRKDATWNVPEPELTLFVNQRGEIKGYTIGNDMSSRDIEGENPLYLPQAKSYERSASLGPGLYIPSEGAGLAPQSEINLQILRAGTGIFSEKTTLSQMKRQPRELVDWLFRECEFPYGCFLMTGTGIVPPASFSLQVGDEVRISIPPIGTLINFVGQNPRT